MGDSSSEKKAQSQWYVYLLCCADNTYYAGVTTDCERRVREHNGIIKGGARYTQARRPVQIVWSEPCDDRSAACKREAQLKKLKRAQKEFLIKSQNTAQLA
jgi:putative endonuclease